MMVTSERLAHLERRHAPRPRQELHRLLWALQYLRSARVRELQLPAGVAVEGGGVHGVVCCEHSWRGWLAFQSKEIYRERETNSLGHVFGPSFLFMDSHHMYHVHVN